MRQSIDSAWMGLLSERQRGRFAELGILQYETWSDPFADLEQASVPKSIHTPT